MASEPSEWLDKMMIRDVISQEEFASVSELDLVRMEDLCFIFISEELNQDVPCSREIREARSGNRSQCFRGPRKGQT